MAIKMGASMGKDYFLRSYYEVNRDARKKATRSNMSNGQKSVADTNALKKAVKDLEKVNYEETEKDGELYNKFLAFVNTYNNTLESTGDKSSNDLKRMQKRLKQVTENFKKEFEELGVKINEDGTLKLGDDAADKFTIERMKALFSEKDSKYGKNLMSCAKKMWSQAEMESHQSGGFDMWA